MVSVFPALLLSVLLPTGWNITPDPSALTLGTLPVAIAASPDEHYLAVTESGEGPSGVRLIDARSGRDLGIVPFSGGVYGRAAWQKNGSGFWIAVSGSDAVAHVSLSPLRVDRTIRLSTGGYPVSVALSPDGAFAAVSQLLGGTVSVVRLRDGVTLSNTAAGYRPNGVSWSNDGRTVYAALWGSNALAAIDAASGRVIARIPTGLHPQTIVGTGRLRYVLAADDDRIDVIDTQRRQNTAHVSIGLLEGLPAGISPSAAVVDATGQRLYAVCSAANAVAVFSLNAEHLTLLGAIPTGWFPTDIAIAGGRVFIVNGRGEGSAANPLYSPFSLANPRRDEFVGLYLKGSLRVRNAPDSAQLQSGLAAVRAQTHHDVYPHPAQSVVRPNGPITHVIFVVKENRTYDQVLGDLGIGDGDPRLALFGETITPNEHAIARRFGVFDRFFASGQVTANGLNWSTAAFANDYDETLWPAQYAHRGMPYDFEDGSDAAHAHAGHLWDAAARAHITYRDYGMWVTNGWPIGTPATTHEAALAGHIDPRYRGFDLDESDSDRESEWQREFEQFERTGTLPALEIIRLPDDHTAGTRPGSHTPQAMVADNDLALGRIIDAVSHSSDWPHTLVVVLEDDAQNGPDHVDEQRTVLLLASPYAHAGVYHDRYSTVSALRTIERILGLPPLSPYDATAPTLDAALHEPADFSPYDAVPAQVDLNARNGAHAYRAAENFHYDWSRADAVPDAFLNDVLLHSSATFR